MNAKASKSTWFGYIQTAILLFSGVYLVSGDSDESSKSTLCSTVDTRSEISMSSGFVTAALAAVGQVGYGACDPDTGTCSEPLHACPGKSCCLPSTKLVKNCGCLETRYTSQGVKSVCVDPKLFSLSGTGCSATGAKQNISVQISFDRNDEACVAKTESQLTVLDNGSMRVKFQHKSCGSNGFKQLPVVSADSNTPIINVDFEIDPNGIAHVTANRLKLVASLDIETLEELLAYKKSQLTSLPTKHVSD